MVSGKATQQDYLQLRESLKRQGLFQRSLLPYLPALASMLCCTAAAAWLVWWYRNELGAQFLAAALLAYVFGQFGFLAHDASHQHLFRNRRHNQIAAVFLWSLCCGVSAAWWHKKHTKHHAVPNHEAQDPDIEIGMLAFTSREFLSRRGLQRLVSRLQKYTFLPLLGLVAVGFRVDTWKFLWSQPVSRSAVEAVLIVVHLLTYFAAAFFIFGLWGGLLFVTCHHVMTGLYLGGIFAPNHFGMPILDANTPYSRLQSQVVTSRNIRTLPALDFVFGGLNYQIEHHLFPDLPRHRLHRVRGDVIEFCERNQLRYHEVGMVAAYREILNYLGAVVTGRLATPVSIPVSTDRSHAETERAA